MRRPPHPDPLPQNRGRGGKQKAREIESGERGLQNLFVVMECQDGTVELAPHEEAVVPVLPGASLNLLLAPKLELGSQPIWMIISARAY
jgi:hypothetical protein